MKLFRPNSGQFLGALEKTETRLRQGLKPIFDTLRDGLCDLDLPMSCDNLDPHQNRNHPSPFKYQQLPTIIGQSDPNDNQLKRRASTQA
jgi:hypothetical protein